MDDDRSRKKRKLNSDPPSVLDGILGSVKQSMVERMDGKEAQRQCTDIDEERMIQNFALLFCKHILAPEEENSLLEVEIRVGRTNDASFKPGVSQSDYFSLDKFMKEPNIRNDFESRFEETVDLFYEMEDIRYRLTCSPVENAPRPDPDSFPKVKEVLKGISKNCNFKDDFKGIAGRWDPLYDLRASFTEEVFYDLPKDCPVDDVVPWDAITDWRFKKRTSFTPRDKNHHWRIEMTETLNRNSEQNFEVEFELLENSTKELQDLPEDDEKKIEKAEELAKDLIQMLNVVFDRSKALKSFVPLIQGVRTSKLGDQELLTYYRTECILSIPRYNSANPNPSKIGFPGTMPVSFSRRHFDLVQSQEYFVSEKADGVRYFLYISSQGVFFIDRKFDFFEVQEFDILREIFPRKTIVDGEIVMDLVGNVPKYVVFDVLEINGENFCQEDTFKRHERIGTFVGTLREKVTERWPFEILGKVFFPKAMIADLLKKIDHVGVYRNPPRRHYACDGLLFTPKMGAYHPKGNEELLKWKFLDHQSIDFQAELSHDRRMVQLFCEGNDKTRTLCRRIQIDDDRDRDLVAALSRRAHARQNIVEFTFDSMAGFWKFKMVRTDKDKPNHTTVAFDTLEAIAQNITREELIYRIPRPLGRDDWSHRQREFMENLLRQGHQGRPAPSHNPHPHRHDPHSQPKPLHR